MLMKPLPLPKDSIFVLYDDYEIIEQDIVKMQYQLCELYGDDFLEEKQYCSMILELLKSGYELYFVDKVLYVNNFPYLHPSGKKINDRRVYYD